MEDIYRHNLQNEFDTRINKSLNQFWAGFIVYTCSYALMISGVVSPKIVYLQLAGLLIFILPINRILQFKIENSYLRTIYIIYLCWLFFVVARGMQFNYRYIFNTLVDGSTGILLYFVPLILLFPNNLTYLRKVIKVIIILSGFFILFDIVFVRALFTSEGEEGKTVVEYFSKILAIPSGFILFTIIYSTDKKTFWSLFGRAWVFLIIIVTTLLAIIRARRGLTFMSLNILFFTYIIYNSAKKNNLFYKISPLIILFFLCVYIIQVRTEKKTDIFSSITERLHEDSRSDVEQYFYLDMSNKDMIIGRGADGYYYCPTGATEDGYRGTIETDFLQIILKGGLVSLVLLLLITLPAIFKGLFYSKNILSKASATWILLWLTDSYPANVSTFNLNYILVWICVSICYSKEILNMPEKTLKELFQYKIF